MNALMLSRLLGWFSLALGAAQIAVPATLCCGLDLPATGHMAARLGPRLVLT